MAHVSRYLHRQIKKIWTRDSPRIAFYFPYFRQILAQKVRSKVHNNQVIGLRYKNGKLVNELQKIVKKKIECYHSTRIGKISFFNWRLLKLIFPIFQILLPKTFSEFVVWQSFFRWRWQCKLTLIDFEIEKSITGSSTYFIGLSQYGTSII